jgi:hypothetical protein
MNRYAALASFALYVSGAQVAAAQDLATSLVGTWKLTGFVRQELATGKQDKFFGEKPVGYNVYTKGGRFVVYLIGENRKQPAKGEATDAERAALYNSMYAYSGKYRVEGDTLVLDVDGSWNQAWTATQRKQIAKIDGNSLTIRSMPFKGTVTGVEIVVINTFERVD